jgi:arginase family enzyme
MISIPHTVSIMWQVLDHISREVMIGFFQEIKNENGQVHVSLCSDALHISTQPSER